MHGSFSPTQWCTSIIHSKVHMPPLQKNRTSSISSSLIAMFGISTAAQHPSMLSHLFTSQFSAPKSCSGATSLFVDRNVIKIRSKQGYFSTTLIRNWPLAAAVWSRARDVVQFCSSNIQFTCHFQSRFFFFFFFFKKSDSQLKKNALFSWQPQIWDAKKKVQWKNHSGWKKRDAQKRCIQKRWVQCVT